MDWIRKQARLYQNLAQTMRYQAVVHLEDKEDESFWNYQLQSVKPGRYRYLYYSKSKKGTDSRGCEQCLQFRPYLTDRFFICIDSDLRLLRGELGLVAANHIAQTYTYSWENHLCEAVHLSERKDKVITNADFDFQTFLYSFSKIVYKPLLYLIQYGADNSTKPIVECREIQCLFAASTQSFRLSRQWCWLSGKAERKLRQGFGCTPMRGKGGRNSHGRECLSSHSGTPTVQTCDAHRFHALRWDRHCLQD